MRDSFNNIIQKTNEFNVLIEDTLNMLPDSPKNYKLKKRVEAAYKTLKRAMERHEDMITDSVPPVSIKTDLFTKDFLETWAIYKDYLIEQFGIRMRSRMEKFRMDLLFDLTGKDMEKAKQWLEYYMSAGSSSIYPVNDFEIKEQKNGKTTEFKAGFSLPKGKGKVQ